MIVRIVKMTFIPSHVNDFLSVFNAAKGKIFSSEGCTHLELLKETGKDNVFFTYSIWETEKDLETYRRSDLFVETWAKTKILFADKPLAWSLEQTSL